VHFVPGGQDRLLEKSLALPADALVLDLEDAVASERKHEAREAVRGWLAQRDFGARERIVRINPMDSGLGEADLDAVLGAAPDAIMLPKVRGAEDLHALDARLSQLEVQHGLAAFSVKVIPIATETPEAVLHLPEIARAPRVDALTWGGEDLSAALGARRNRGDDGRYLDVFRHARVSTLLAAAAAGIEAIDAVYTDFRDLEGLRAESNEAADMGFDGKLTIHPDQIPVVNEVFAPSSAAIAEAQRLVEAFQAHQHQGRGVFALDGQMIDAPHMERARKLLERAERLGMLERPR
jgi:citrate lyase subunit beta/citryl-CoA lyase